MNQRHEQDWAFSIYFLILVLSSGLLLIDGAHAQEVEVSSSLNPVGSGARAAGMGGAFIGVADDATAASWNPGGLTQLERPEISAVYSSYLRKQKYSLNDSNGGEFLDLEGDNEMDADGLNYASAAYPFVLFNRNMIVSINYQRMFEMNKDVEFMAVRDIGFGDVANEGVNFVQNGFLYTVSPAFAVQVTPAFSLGATLNLWDDIVGDNAWDNSYRSHVTIDSGSTHIENQLVQKDETSFEGTNAHLGFLWSINGAFMLGGVYKTPFTADVERIRSIYQKTTTDISMPSFPPFHFESVYDDKKKEQFEYKMPASYGLGLSYRHSDNLTVALDVYRTEWSRFVIRDEDENEINPLTGACISRGREGSTKCGETDKTRLKDTTQVRLGIEYLFIRQKDVIPLRFGVFYDPEPQTGHLDHYYGISVGSGYARERFAVDFAYQYRRGRDLTGDTPTIKGSNADIDQHLFMISSIFYF